MGIIIKVSDNEWFIIFLDISYTTEDKLPRHQ